MNKEFYAIELGNIYFDLKDFERIIFVGDDSKFIFDNNIEYIKNVTEFFNYKAFLSFLINFDCESNQNKIVIFRDNILEKYPGFKMQIERLERNYRGINQ